ncbi:restriction endonuclease subunit S [Sphingomonas sp. CFBP 8765]|uniref:restriction endonuclease subunit S n=1 Tax=Sphingomonas sp. CFBP 8765 TaxID=2775274 RepID=UPI00177B2050|nr:restriction endonuclease subunit S [Sphingomonas sp. CFBP 8765]
MATALGEIVTLRGDKVDPASVPEKSFIGLEDIEPHTSAILRVGQASEVKSSVACFEAGDVLYSRLRPYLNKVARPDFPGVASAEILALKPSDAAEAEFVRRNIMTRRFLDFTAMLDKGDRPRVSYDEIAAFQLSLPPLPEQRRIVAKIDSLTGKSRRARDHLDHIPRLVERYKQAVLNLAFSHLAERTRLLDMVASERGIPYGIVQTGTPYKGGIPTVRCGDIKDFRVGLDQLKRVDPEIEQGYQRTRLNGGEVLIAIRGSVGETCVAPAQFAGCNISREVAMIPPKSDISPKFIMYFLATSEAKRFILGNTKGVAQQGINLRDLKELPTPDCSLNEQIAVAERIEAAFTWIDRLAADSNIARRLIDHLDQSVLAKAFKGEIVPQDPSDEPAAALIERIRAERAAAPKAKRGRKKAA